METYLDITVIIPTFNEEENIGELLGLLTKLYPKIFVIVTDDGSEDNTQKIVQEHSQKNKRVRLLDRGSETDHGITISVMDAVLISDTTFVVIIDGDLQHPPEKIKEIVEKLRSGNDLIVGARTKVLVQWPWHRKLISWGAKKLGELRLFSFGCPIVTDVGSGFFGTKTELFKQKINVHKQRFEPKGYKVLFDYLKLLSKETKVDEVFYEFGLRTKGESKLRTKHILLYLKSLFK